MKWELTSKRGANAGEPPDAGAQSWWSRAKRIVGLEAHVRPGTAAFTLALVSLSAKLAKADGVASRIEADVFERLHQIVPDERDTIRQMFERAARDVIGFDDYAHEVVRLLGGDRERLRDVMEGLFHIAAADGILHPEEERHLQRAGDAFGMSALQFRTLRALFVHDPTDPYTTLGLAHDADDAAVKARYKQLAREHHPDLLAARGAPAEFIALATAKLAEINAAYEQIMKERAA